jgi:hypothetical protein
MNLSAKIEERLRDSQDGSLPPTVLGSRSLVSGEEAGESSLPAPSDVAC